MMPPDILQKNILQQISSEGGESIYIFSTGGYYFI